MLLEEDLAYAVVIDRPIVANLARRSQEDHPLNKVKQATDGAAGDTDYPELEPATS